MSEQIKVKMSPRQKWAITELQKGSYLVRYTYTHRSTLGGQGISEKLNDWLVYNDYVNKAEKNKNGIGTYTRSISETGKQIKV